MIVTNTQNTSGLTPVKLNEENKTSTTTSTTERYDTFQKQGVTESVTYQPPKKLTQEQVNELNRQRVESTIRIMTAALQKNVATQAGQASGIFELNEDSANLLSEIFGSLEAAYPTPATTPEGAAAAVADGGAYSVEAVTERIMKMATFIAGDDPQLLAEMQEAVKQGFAAAGLDLNTGEGMPEITMNTYNSVMGEFDRLLGKDLAE